MLAAKGFGQGDRVSEAIVAQVPDAWLGGDAPFGSAAAHRDAYVRYLCRRLEAPHAFVEEALRARV